ncbi:ABC transporter permease [Psychrobacillus sp.]|uniref:ABC transporter permease n=1 Tax=Psychrobacillus sp. TaxID=1871623 RepID=UPI0028BDEAEF|nr:ABC transporter permease [Psychrobacillus sp.]
MTLFSLAKKNMFRNFSQYFLYMASMVFCIVIYFTFVTLKYNDTMEELSSSSLKLDALMSGAAFVLLFFVTIFIAYSNSFFMRKRKKEVALYSLLGVRKKQIGWMLFFENFLIGFFALVVGIVLGFLLSKIFLTILIQMMGFDTFARFTFSIEAAIDTTIVFLTLFLITSFQGYRLIYQFKLIDLFHAAKKGEGIPKASFLMVIVGVGLISFAYWLALQDLFTSEVWRKIGMLIAPLLIIGAVILGSYLLFHSVTVFLLAGMKKNVRWLWRGLNVMTVSQLLYRIRGNAKTLTVIAILSATTITAGGSVYGLYYNIESSIQKGDPNTFMYQETDEAWVKEVEGLLEKENYVYKEKLTVITVEAEEIEGSDRKMMYTVLSDKHFNQLAKLQNSPDQLDLDNKQTVILDALYDERFTPNYSGKDIIVNGREKLTINNFKPYNVLNVGVSGPTLVVSEVMFEQLQKVDNVMTLVAYGFKQSKEQLEISSQIEEILPAEVLFSSLPKDFKSSIESVGSLLFIGSFLGLVFLAATGSIIYFKVLTEAEEDKEKYKVLHKIGVSQRDILKTIATQVFSIFMAPLVVGILHSAIALIAFSQLLSMDLTKPVTLWIIAYTVIYGVYYVMTVFSFNRTVQQNYMNEG